MELWLARQLLKQSEYLPRRELGEQRFRVEIRRCQQPTLNDASVPSQGF
jgi:hypothetical protein